MVVPPDSEEQRQIVPEAAPLEAQPGPADYNDPALKEAVQFSTKKSAQQLADEARQRDHYRGEKFRDNFEILAICSMYLIFATMCIFGIVWILHMLLPDHCDSAKCLIYGIKFCRWLSSDQITILQDIVTGGLIGGILADHFKRRMDRN
jgi:hypothetical protein